MRCRWCGQPVRLVRDLWLTEDGQLCTPQLRGAVCALHYYREQRTIMHLPYTECR